MVDKKNFMQDKNTEGQNQQHSNDSGETKIYLTSDCTLQTPEEVQHDKKS